MIKMIFLSTFFVLSSAFAQPQESFFPTNDLFFPLGVKLLGGGLSQEAYNRQIDRVVEANISTFSSRGLKLSINRDWMNAEVNAFASVSPLMPANRMITLTGGLARHPLMTEDSFALVFCHEVGHHLGGAPEFASGLSAEEEADYFSTLKCARKLFLHDDNQKVIQGTVVPAALESACKKAFVNLNDMAVCIRTGLGSQILGKILSSMSRQPQVEPKFDTPDRTIVAKTILSYGSVQCRIDTLFQGSLCDKSFNEEMSDRDLTKGACHSALGDSIGNRPRCWFKP
jgi:hypothetical protein